MKWHKSAPDTCNLAKSLRLHSSRFGKQLGNIFLQVEHKEEQAFGICIRMWMWKV
jgi:hypothetical protein